MRKSDLIIEGLHTIRNDICESKGDKKVYLLGDVSDIVMGIQDFLENIISRNRGILGYLDWGASGGYAAETDVKIRRENNREIIDEISIIFSFEGDSIFTDTTEEKVRKGIEKEFRKDSKLKNFVKFMKYIGEDGCSAPGCSWEVDAKGSKQVMDLLAAVEKAGGEFSQKYYDIYDIQDRISESSLNESFGREILVIDYRYKLEDAIVNGLEKKYSGLLAKYGDFGVGIDMDLGRDRDREIDNIAEVLYLGFGFENSTDGYSPKDVMSALTKIIKPLKGYKITYDTKTQTYEVDIKGNDDILEFILDMNKDGINLKKFYHIEDLDDVDRRLQDRNDRWERERREQERDYWNSVRPR